MRYCEEGGTYALIHHLYFQAQSQLSKDHTHLKVINQRFISYLSEKLTLKTIYTCESRSPTKKNTKNTNTGHNWCKDHQLQFEVLIGIPKKCY